MIAHYQYTCQEGKPLLGCPPKLLQQFIRDGLTEFKGEPDEAIPGFEDTTSDCLGPLSRQQLLIIIRDNELKKFFTPMKSWSDEQIRTAIREVVADLEELKMPAAPAPVVVAPTPAPQPEEEA